jgi:hypothetical protein
MRKLGMAVIGVVALSLASCKESQYKDAIVGKWQGQMQGITITLDIRKDGTMDYVGFPAKWKLDGSDNLKITTDREIPGTNTKRFQSKVSITGDTLTLTDEVGPTKGQSIQLKRVGGAPTPPPGPKDPGGKP